VDLASLVLPLIVLDNIAEEVARRHQVLPLRVDRGNLFVAVADPNNATGIDEISFLSGKKIVAYAAHASHLMQAIDEAYEARRLGQLEWRGPKVRGGGMAAGLRSAAAGRGPEIMSFEEAARLNLRQAEQGPTPDLKTPFFGESSYQPPRPQTEPAGLVARVRKRILVVDDEQVIRKIVQQALLQRGYEVIEADKGIDALRMVKDKEPDAILLDALLPDVHGFDICKRLKASKRYGHIPIVMMTAVYKGWRMAADLKDSYGVSALIEKPFDLHELVRALEGAIAGNAAPKPDEHSISQEAQRLFSEGQAAFKRGDVDGAIQSISAAAAVDPLSASLHHQLGLLYAHRGHDFAAIQELEMAVDLEPERYPLLRNLALLYQRRGFRRKAIEMWERALALATDETTRAEIKGILVSLL
jgi:DNA-binding response OmpR family regulator